MYRRFGKQKPQHEKYQGNGGKKSKNRKPVKNFVIFQKGKGEQKTSDRKSCGKPRQMSKDKHFSKYMNTGEFEYRDTRKKYTNKHRKSYGKPEERISPQKGR